MGILFYVYLQTVFIKRTLSMRCTFFCVQVQFFTLKLVTFLTSKLINNPKRPNIPFLNMENYFGCSQTRVQVNKYKLLMLNKL